MNLEIIDKLEPEIDEEEKPPHKLQAHQSTIATQIGEKLFKNDELRDYSINY